MKIMNKLKLALLLAVLILTGCEKAEDLEASVNSRWQAIVDKDYTVAYEYFSPGYKKVESLDGFKLRMLTAQLNMKWSKGTFKEAACASEDVCEVAAEVVYDFTFSKRSMGGIENIPSQVKENWIKIDGKWFYVPKS